MAMISEQMLKEIQQSNMDAMEICGNQPDLVDKYEPKSEISVFVRFRPMVGTEVKDSHKAIDLNIVSSEESVGVEMTYASNKPARISMKKLIQARRRGITLEPQKCETTWKGDGLENAFNAADDNVSVFEKSIKPHLDRVLDGGIVNCFAYGHTGSGKTHTQMGYGEEKGMFYLAVQELEERLSKLNEECGYEAKICVQMFELHNKKAYDLLSNRRECFIRQHENGEVDIRAQVQKDKEGIPYAGTITTALCKTADEVEQVVREGADLRRVGVSTLHEQSSRSHAFIVISFRSPKVLELEEKLNTLDGKVAYWRNQAVYRKAQEMNVKLVKVRKALKRARSDAKKKHKAIGGQLVFADLAGSEHGTDEGSTDQTPEQKREGRQINISLMALNDVFRAKMSGSSRIPFRSSPLTMVMRDFLYPDCACIMLAACSPSEEHVKRTVNTLRYATLIAKN